MKKHLLLILFFIAGNICCLAQESINVTSPSATEFVKYERIPVSYFNGLPSIEIPLYTIESNGMTLPISISYYASGIRVNQYPTCVGLGWNLSAGGCITRAINGIPDETDKQDQVDQTGYGYNWNPGYYFSSTVISKANWASEDILKVINSFQSKHCEIDTEPDEFAINAYGISGSVYFYRDSTGVLKNKVKSNNGVSFRVEAPKMLQNPEAFKFPGGGTQSLQSYRIYELFYEFTVIKNDGTKLVFGGSDDSIEFYTERTTKKNYAGPSALIMKTWPTAWMLREIISPEGRKITFNYMRDGSPIIISDVRKDLTVINNGIYADILPSQNADSWKSFIVQHPVYPKSITVDGGLCIDFYMSKADDMNTVGDNYKKWLQNDGFSPYIEDNVCYEKTGSRIPYAPHNFSMKLNEIKVSFKDDLLRSFGFSYTENKNERIKLKSLTVNNGSICIQKYQFSYNPLKLPEYNATVTDNWGYWNAKNYRSLDELPVSEQAKIFFDFRSSDEFYAKAEVLTGITYPSGGDVSFEYELNDYSKVATQAPDFEILNKSGKAGGLRIKQIRYSTDTTSYIHSFTYKNEDGNSSGILSGIPVYYAKGGIHGVSYFYSSWRGLTYFREHGTITQDYSLWSEAYINSLGLTTGNNVTYSRITESIASEEPLVKEYRYTNHDSWPDTADFKMYTNIDNVSLDNKFTSRALMRGLLTDEIWYSNGKVVKKVQCKYKSNTEDFNDYAKSIEQFTIPGVSGYLITINFVRYTPYKILTFYPGLESHTETLYDPSGQTVISSVTENCTYNSNLLLKTKSSNLSNGDIQTMTVTYPDEYSTEIFKTMNSRGMVSNPVETVIYRNGKAAEGNLLEYRLFNSVIVPDKQWRLCLTEGLDSASFRKYNGSARDPAYRLDYETEKADRYGNPLLVKSSDGMETSYLWGYSYSYPTAAVLNAANTYKETIVHTPQNETGYIYLHPVNTTENLRTYTFTSSESSDVTFKLGGALGYDWYVEGKLDGQLFHVVQTRSGLPLAEPWNRYVQAYGSSYTFRSIPAGEHTITIVVASMREGSYAGNEDGGLSYSYRGSTSHTETSGADEFLYEDFESSSPYTYPFGYNSGRCFVGKYTIDLKGDSGRKLILDYRVYRNGRWEYVMKDFPGMPYTIDEGLNPIDDVRVRPCDAGMETYSWYPFTGLRSRTDGGGVTESYSYDFFGRLQTIKDNGGNITSQYDYHYAGMSVPGYVPVYYNEKMSMDFSSSLCDESKGRIPVPVTYTVPAGTYCSHESVEDANRLAFEDLIADGQKYADKNGTCRSYVIVTIFNSLPETLSLEYYWGTQGDVKSMSFPIPPFSQVSGPTVIYIPRYNYRSVVLKNSNGDFIPFTAESGFTTFDFTYSEADYPDYKDIYIIGK